MSASEGRVFVVGSANMDLIVRTPALPRPGETLLGGPFTTAPGGKGANQAVAAARMGAPVIMIARLGDDAHGTTMRAVLSADHIDTAHVRTTPDAPTGVALITVDHAGENTIIVAPGANAHVSTDDLAPLANASARDVALFQLEVPLDTITRAAAIARKRGATTILNAAPAAALPRDLLAALDILIVNETEAAVVLAAEATATTPPTTPTDLTRALLALGPRRVILTLGAQGAILAKPDTTTAIPAAKVTPIDTVGAGDAFCGVLAASLAEGLDITAACRRASAAGALATQIQGAIPSLPRRDDILALTARLPA